MHFKKVSLCPQKGCQGGDKYKIHNDIPTFIVINLLTVLGTQSEKNYRQNMQCLYIFSTTLTSSSIYYGLDSASKSALFPSVSICSIQGSLVKIGQVRNYRNMTCTKSCKRTLSSGQLEHRLKVSLNRKCYTLQGQC